MKKILLMLCSLSVVGFMTVTSCSKEEEKKTPETPENPEDPDDPDNPETPEARKSLLTLWDGLIEEYKTTGKRSKVFIVAHRGNTVAGTKLYLPDNSIPNVEMAIAKGADMVEIDIRPTADNELVCCHDATINASTNGTGTVSEMTYEEICKYDMKKGSKVYKDANGNTIKMPTLKQMLEACKDKIYVNLDLAGKNVPVGKCVRIIQECGMVDQVMIYTGGDYSLAREYQYKDVNLAVHPQIGAASDVSKYASLPGAKLFQYSNTLYLSTNPEIGKQVHEAGALSYSNLLDNYDKSITNGDYTPLDKFIASESDYVQTDVFELVDEYLQQKGLRKGSSDTPGEGDDPDDPGESGETVEGSVIAYMPEGTTWPEGAEIGVWTADDSNMKFTLTSASGNKGGFSGQTTEGSNAIAAYYPYQEGVSMTNIPISFPTEIAVGDELPGLYLAKITGENELSFVNKVATLKISFSEIEGSSFENKVIKGISIQSAYRKLFGTYEGDASNPTRTLASKAPVAAAHFTFASGTTLKSGLEAVAAIAPISKANDEYTLSIELEDQTIDMSIKNASAVGEGEVMQLKISGADMQPKIRMEWGYKAGNRFAGHYPAVDADGNVYFTLLDDTKLYKVSPTGELCWAQDIGFTGNQKTSPAIEADGSVIYATGGSGGTGVLRAFNADGSTKWTLTSDKFYNKGNTPSPNFNYTTPAIGSSCVFIGNAGSTGTVLSVNKATGERVAYVGSADGTSGPAGGAYTGVSISKGGVVSWGASYGFFAASLSEMEEPTHTNETCGAYVPWGLRSGPNWNSGKPWSSVNPNGGIACTTIDGKNYLVFCADEQTTSGTHNMHIYWEDASQGLAMTAPGLSQAWTKEVKVSGVAKQDQGGIVIGPRNEAIVSLKNGASEGGLVAYNIDGTLAWEFRLAQDVGGAAAVDNNGYIHVIADWPGDYYILKPDYTNKTAEVVVKANLLEIASVLDSSVSSADRIRGWTSVVIGDDGKMYVGGSLVESGAQSGYLMCLSYPLVTGPGETSWPMRGADAKHSGVQVK